MPRHKIDWLDDTITFALNLVRKYAEVNRRESPAFQVKIKVSSTILYCKGLNNKIVERRVNKGVVKFRQQFLGLEEEVLIME